ncbi:FAD/NAD-binding domain-containing protein [Laetiporus sulphureus 93-53]|uniref:FAD/NAD-binding domain-containing protein n=1 Tax=Laetiporus sulphureus 93-53 TaxID=1314785 RepID=A0A165CSP6_9APHY|nr:FAD/NAD-binding domain-containing protein [Laetiporus sulphureus 93-53]KZT03369.1 FAD/NAD-binding domain-containing protein [Laetiporus sulphureus 93-53]
MTRASHEECGDVVDTQVVIVGGGLGGISCAIALKRQLGCGDFLICEKAGNFGGTWRDNTYPGSACDTPTHWYSLSTEQNPHWSASLAPQPELLAYWQSLAARYALHEHTFFHTRVASAVWDESACRWDVDAEDVRTRQRIRIRAKAVVSATGILTEPKMPEIEGLEQFGGSCFHSARWDHGVDFRGKRVAVIGNGASAAQFVPCLAADPNTCVIQFCRTPNWFLYSSSDSYSPARRWILAHVPLAMRLFRLWVVLVRLGTPVMRDMWRKITKGGSMQDDAIAYMKRTAPAKYHDKLIPTFPIGCRRPVFDPGYLACLHQPNVQLNWDGIREITTTGIVTNQGDHLLVDAIVLSTGFQTGIYPISVTGRMGVSLEGFFESEDGPAAHLGVCVPGFPNCLIIGGPNTVTGNGSAVFTHEIEINYIVQLIKPLIHTPNPLSISIRSDAYMQYNSQLRDALAGNSYTGCPPSWFRGSGGTGRNFSIFPWSHGWFWWLLRNVNWVDYSVEGPGAAVWLKNQERARRRRRALASVLIVSLVLYRMKT